MYISIITIKGYEQALNMLLQSIPKTFKNIIIIYQNEENESIMINENKYIIVKIRHNIYEYGSFIGLYRVLEANLIDKNEIILLLHDTCKFGEKSIELCEDLVSKMRSELKSDIVFLSSLGHNNICFVNKTAIDYGYNVYKDTYTMPKSLAIDLENNIPYDERSIKSFYVKRTIIDIDPINKGKIKIYGDIERTVNYFSIIDLEKYCYEVDKYVLYHPEKP